MSEDKSMDQILAESDAQHLDAGVKEYLQDEIILNNASYVPQEVADFYARKFKGDFLADYAKNFIDFLIENAPQKTEMAVLNFAAFGRDVLAAIVYTIAKKGSSVITPELLPETNLRSELGFDRDCFEMFAGTALSKPFVKYPVFGHISEQETIGDMMVYTSEAKSRLPVPQD